jgi:hypothetical protein
MSRTWCGVREKAPCPCQPARCRPWLGCQAQLGHGRAIDHVALARDPACKEILVAAQQHRMDSGGMIRLHRKHAADGFRMG